MSEVTLELLKAYLERFGWNKYEATEEPYEKEGLIMTGWKTSSGSPHELIIDPIVEKKVLVFHSPLLGITPEKADPERIKELGLFLSMVNAEILLGKFSYSQNKNVVGFSIVVPIETGLNYEEFEHCLYVTVSEVEKTFPLVIKILEGELSAQEAIFEREWSREDFARFAQGVLSRKDN